MWQFLESLENSGFSIWVRETPSVLAYPTVLALHTFGMAFLVGFSAMLGLRVLGYAPDIPLAPMDKLYKLIYFGFGLAATAGLVLIIQGATVFTIMPLFYFKLLAIAASMVCVVKLRKYVAGARGPVPGEAKVLASMMFIFWGVAVVCGRLTAYAWTPIGTQTIVAILISTAVFLAVMFISSKLMPEKARSANVRTSTGY